MNKEHTYKTYNKTNGKFLAVIKTTEDKANHLSKTMTVVKQLNNRPFTHIAWGFFCTYNQYLSLHKKEDSKDPIVSEERYTELCNEYDMECIPF